MVTPCVSLRVGRSARDLLDQTAGHIHALEARDEAEGQNPNGQRGEIVEKFSMLGLESFFAHGNLLLLLAERVADPLEDRNAKGEGDEDDHQANRGRHVGVDLLLGHVSSGSSRDASDLVVGERARPLFEEREQSDDFVRRQVNHPLRRVHADHVAELERTGKLAHTVASDELAVVADDPGRGHAEALDQPGFGDAIDFALGEFHLGLALEEIEVEAGFDEGQFQLRETAAFARLGDLQVHVCLVPRDSREHSDC